ncbi:MAG: hypothetical protein Q7V57_01160 [Actinomycetota bacterium]|nr:hypothetical protein [Actinomycetota bacterium]
MRRLLALGSCLVLVAACSDSDSTASTSSAAAPVTSAAGETAPAAPLTPEVVCVANNGSGDGEQPDYAFAYTNDSAEPVVLSASDSVVADGEAADLMFVTKVFAPGHVSPAFFVTGDAGGQPPSWTIVGPDGQTRTATPDEATPNCDGTLDLPPYTTDDQRDPVVEVSGLQLNADGTVSFTTTLTGADTSVCPEGLDPQPTTITWDDLVGGNVTDGPTAEWTVPQPQYEGNTFAYQTIVAALVLDGCAYGDATQTIWPGGVFESLYTGVYVCIAEADGTLTASTSQNDDDCHGLPHTGGDRIRPA